jgi:hypothetical protein
VPHWLAVTLAVATSLAAWRWAVRPLIRFARDFIEVLRQIRTAATGIAKLTQEVRGLAGSIVTLAAAMLSDQQALRTEHVELRDNHRELTQLVVDLDADVRRVERAVEANTRKLAERT